MTCIRISEYLSYVEASKSTSEGLAELYVRIKGSIKTKKALLKKIMFR